VTPSAKWSQNPPLCPSFELVRRILRRRRHPELIAGTRPAARQRRELVRGALARLLRYERRRAADGDGVTQGRDRDTVRRPLRPFSLTVQASGSTCATPGSPARFRSASTSRGARCCRSSQVTCRATRCRRRRRATTLVALARLDPYAARGVGRVGAAARCGRTRSTWDARSPNGPSWSATATTTRATWSSRRLPVALIDFDPAHPTTRPTPRTRCGTGRRCATRGPRPRSRTPTSRTGSRCSRTFRHDGVASRGAGAVRRRHGAPLPRVRAPRPSWTRFPQAMGGRCKDELPRAGRGCARRPGDHRWPRPARQLTRHTGAHPAGTEHSAAVALGLNGAGQELPSTR
jgi:hypothetical protein